MSPASTSTIVVPRAQKAIPEAPGHYELAVPCYGCNGPCRRSHRIGFRDHMLGWLGWYPWRCYLCGTHYYLRRSV